VTPRRVPFRREAGGGWSIGPRSGLHFWDRSDAYSLERCIVRGGNLSPLFTDVALRVADADLRFTGVALSRPSRVTSPERASILTRAKSPRRSRPEMRHSRSARDAVDVDDAFPLRNPHRFPLRNAPVRPDLDALCPSGCVILREERRCEERGKGRHAESVIGLVRMRTLRRVGNDEGSPGSPERSQ